LQEQDIRRATLFRPAKDPLRDFRQRPNVGVYSNVELVVVLAG
jgi:hypothetical protein